jgi:hypothetical protein
MERRHVLQLHVDLPGLPVKRGGRCPDPEQPLPPPSPAGADPIVDQLNDLHRDLREAFPDLDRDEQIRSVERLRQIADDLEAQIRQLVVVEVQDPAGAYHCASCDRDLADDEVIEVRECSYEGCAAVFDGSEGRNCPECNRPFSRVVTQHGCPDCQEEVNEVAAAATEPETVTA